MKRIGFGILALLLAAPAIPAVASVPHGSYQSSCRNSWVNARSNELTARCRYSAPGRMRGTTVEKEKITRLKLPCRGRDIANRNGDLVCER